MTMEIEYVLRPDDVLAFHEYAWDHPTKQMKAAAKGFTILLLFLGLMALLAVPNFMRGDLSATNFFPVTLFAAALLYRLRWRSQKLRLVRRDLEEGADQNSRELGWRRVVLTPEAITTTTERESCTRYWSAVEKIIITGEWALIFTSPTSANIVPGRAFADKYLGR
jgi:hypothetical protein